MRRFVARHLRWAQLRRTCALGPFCTELLLYTSPWLLIPLSVTDSARMSIVCGLALLLRVASDGVLARTVSGRWPSARALALLPVKDTVLLGVWTIAMFRRNVMWRGHPLRIGHGSRLMAGDRLALLRERAASALN